MTFISGTGIYKNLHRGIILTSTNNGTGRGLFAREFIAAGTVLWFERNSEVQSVRISELDQLSDQARETLLHYAWQVSENFISGPFSEAEAEADASNFWNHSCDPNSWLISGEEIAARRDIAVGEEITIDYATWTVLPLVITHQFPDRCCCGTAPCRGVLTGNDWRSPDLQARYRGHFHPFIERKIKCSD